MNLPALAATTTMLTADNFRLVAATAKALDRYNLVEPRSPQDLAFHRFISGMARQSDTDAVLDFTIALEALLLPYDEQARRSELSYRFRIHGAHYLESDVVGRGAMAKRLTDVYNMRSRLVHGSNYPSAEEIKSIRDIASELSRRGLLHAVRDGFPKAELFNRIVLGEVSDRASSPVIA